jgi:hypothetical protein
MTLHAYEVGIVYRFWAESEEHAIEQFVDAIDPQQAMVDTRAVLDQLTAQINWMHRL